jgi:uncharacterized protein (TIGR02118 family)
VGASATSIAPALVAAAETSNPAKAVFVVFKKADLTAAQSFAEWDGAKHTALVRKIPGLKKWVQNRVTGAKNEGNADGIGELWFESAEAMVQGMKSPELAAAAEDAKRFLDMTRTYAIIVEERTIIT